MMKGKTKRGTPLRSTLGMKSPDKRQTWCLVADRHRLCLFAQSRGERGNSLELKAEFLNPDGRKKGRELSSDRPGRSFDSQDRTHGGQKGGARHSYGADYSPEQRAIDTTVREATRLLQENGLMQDGVQLLVVAEPGFMGSLRQSLQKAAPQCQMIFEEKDFAWIAEDQLPKRLSSLLGIH